MSVCLAIVALLLSSAQDSRRLDAPRREGECEVHVVSKTPLRVDVVSTGAPAVAVLKKLARAAAVELTVEPGEAELRSTHPVDAQLRDRALDDALVWIAGSVGLAARQRQGALHLELDAIDDVDSDAALHTLIDRYLVALLHHPDHHDAARIRFEIANLQLALGEHANAILSFEALEQLHPDFGDLAVARFRRGHAHAALGDEPAARAQWLQLVEKSPTHPLVAQAYLECARSDRRETGGGVAARQYVRMVLERLPGPLHAHVILQAAELLVEDGDLERAEHAYRRALIANPSREQQAQILAGLCAVEVDLGQDPRAILTASQFLQSHRNSPEAAQVYRELARAHDHLDDPATALLALREARALSRNAQLTAQCELDEGELMQQLGLAEHAFELWENAATDASSEPTALLAIAELAVRERRYEYAARSLQRLRHLPGHAVEGSLRLAEVAALQRNHARASALLADLAQQTLDADQRTRVAALVRTLKEDRP